MAELAEPTLMDENLVGAKICTHCISWDTQGLLPFDTEGNPLFEEIEPLAPCQKVQGWCYQSHEPHPECEMCPDDN